MLLRLINISSQSTKELDVAGLRKSSVDLLCVPALFVIADLPRASLREVIAHLSTATSRFADVLSSPYITPKEVHQYGQRRRNTCRNASVIPCCIKLERSYAASCTTDPSIAQGPPLCRQLGSHRGRVSVSEIDILQYQSSL